MRYSKYFLFLFVFISFSSHAALVATRTLLDKTYNYYDTCISSGYSLTNTSYGGRTYRAWDRVSAKLNTYFTCYIDETGTQHGTSSADSDPDPDPAPDPIDDTPPVFGPDDFPMGDSDRCEAGKVVSSYYDGRPGFPEACIPINGTTCWAKRHAWGIGVGYKVNYRLTGIGCIQDGSSGSAEASFPSDHNIIPIGDIGTPAPETPDIADPFVPDVIPVTDVTYLGDIDPAGQAETNIPDTNGNTPSTTPDTNGNSTGGTGTGRATVGGNSGSGSGSGSGIGTGLLGHNPTTLDPGTCDPTQFVCSAQFDNAMKAITERQDNLQELQEEKIKVDEENTKKAIDFFNDDIEFADGLSAIADSKLFDLQKDANEKSQDFIETQTTTQGDFFNTVFDKIFPNMLPLGGSCLPLTFMSTNDVSVQFSCDDAAPIRQILGWLFVIYTMLHIYYIVYNNRKER